MVKKTASYLGDTKERIDYFKNRMSLKGMSPFDAYGDYLHDRYVNKVGRQQAKSGLYSNSKDGCLMYRVNGINEKY